VLVLIVITGITRLLIPHSLKRRPKKIMVYAYPKLWQSLGPSVEFDIGVVVLSIVYDTSIS